ncbi:SAM-dependent DNA methyltransferase [Mariprofundus erugo]|uniref:class I SAM-dependent DNA methyltransferase n=1 Tax=Mariprofundus erugo TaxID=2528639 RepID=UPI0010FE7516|nr:class I SAM-dependent DNA methyltransferase [Mariprofundus erugo]TLS77945.1 SAM-dependent DNA methyltransferase [Mariprofundus erugo]
MNNQVNIKAQADLIWELASDVLRDVFQRTEYPDIIYPMILIRRIECVMQSARDQVAKKREVALASLPDEQKQQRINQEAMRICGYTNDTRWALGYLEEAGEVSLKDNFIAYLNGYSENIRQIIKASGIRTHIDKLHTKHCLYPLVKRFAGLDMGTGTISNVGMGYIFEELVRRFSEQNNAEAGEHYTPREVIQLMIQMLDIDHDAIRNGEMKTIYDPACGTGGMLSTAKEYIEKHVNAQAEIRMFGQEVNDKTWAICEADMLLKGEKSQIREGDTLTSDHFPDNTFDYMLSNPPYGKSWKTIQKKVMHNSHGRFDAGYPRSSDGQMLFLQHMISKMNPPDKGGSAIAVVFNGSPLFTGDAGSGESEIRRWIIENDWLEAIIAMPANIFYNTDIATYIWIVRNNKSAKRRGKVQLIDGSSAAFFKPMKKSLGKKRRYISDEQIAELVSIHHGFTEGEHCKVFNTDDFAYRKIFLDLESVDADGQPLLQPKEVSVPAAKLSAILNESSEVIARLKDKNQPDEQCEVRLKPDSEFLQQHNSLALSMTIEKTVVSNRLQLKATLDVPVIEKDSEIVPWNDDWEAFLETEIEQPYTVTEIRKGYEIPFTQHFYVYQPLPTAESVMEAFSELEDENRKLLAELGLSL